MPSLVRRRLGASMNSLFLLILDSFQYRKSSLHTLERKLGFQLILLDAFDNKLEGSPLRNIGFILRY